MDDEKQNFQELKDNEENNQKEKSNIETWNGKRFYYIAGYTTGGAPYGITWEENRKNNNIDEKDGKRNSYSDGELPF